MEAALASPLLIPAFMLLTRRSQILSGLVALTVSKDFTGENRTDDPYGHGTHVAALAAGNGRVSNATYLGIASNAKLINLRVLDANGTGTVSSTLAALDWVLDNKTTYN